MNSCNKKKAKYWNDRSFDPLRISELEYVYFAVSTGINIDDDTIASCFLYDENKII
jgi:hypothetical protein